MPTALILGASRGIGREFVRQLRADNWKVFATARDDAALAELKTLGTEVLKLDVNKPESLAGLGWQLDGEKFDLAVYVAGIYGPRTDASTPPTAQDFDKVMHTNVLGAMQAIPLVAPMVEAAHGRFAFVSSGMASITNAQDGTGWIYRASKAALNMAVKSAASTYPQAAFVALDPGWVRTDMGGNSAPLDVQDSVRGMLQQLSTINNNDSGIFRSHGGGNVPW